MAEIQSQRVVARSQPGPGRRAYHFDPAADAAARNRHINYMPSQHAAPAPAPAPQQQYTAVGGGYNGPSLASLAGNAPQSLRALASYSLQDYQPPPNTAYEQIFNQSLAHARQGVDTQFGLALSEIARQEGIGRENLNRFAPAVNDIWNQAQGASDQWSGASLGALEGTAMGGYGQAPLVDQGVVPMRQAMEINRGRNLADQFYLDQGLTDIFARQRGQAEMTKQQMLSDIMEREFEMRMQQSQQDYRMAHEARLAQWEADRDDFWRGRELAGQDIQYGREQASSRQQWEREQRAREMEGQREREHETSLVGLRARAEKDADGVSYGQGEISAQRGAAISDKLRTQLRNDPNYREIVQWLRSPRVQAMSPEQRFQLLTRYRAGNPLAASVAMLDYNHLFPA